MRWRVIQLSRADAAMNMAVDEAILQAHLEGKAPCTLRFYTFEPAAISIGYAQTLSEDEEAAVRKAGLGLVRRPTGGRAVLHANDLTYSFVGSAVDESAEKQSDSFLAPDMVTNEVLSTSVVSAYKQICQGLILGLAQIGVDVELGSGTATPNANYDCFRATTNADLQYKGKKMIGSAQLRRKTAVLQHGSLLLDQEQARMSSIFNDKDNDSESRHANLYDVTGTHISVEELADHLKEGFQKAFNVNFISEPLSPYETELTAAFNSRYGNFKRRPKQ